MDDVLFPLFPCCAHRHLGSAEISALTESSGTAIAGINDIAIGAISTIGCLTGPLDRDMPEGNSRVGPS